MPQLPATTFSLRRNWIFGGYAAEFSLSLKLTPQLSSSILDHILRAIYSNLCQRGDFCELRNVKGRDPHGALLLATAPALTGEELLAIGGRIATESTAGGFVWEPFHYVCHTRFERFEGSRTIVHTPHTTRTPSIPEWLPWWLLGAAAPIEPTYFRLGLELCTSRFVLTRLSFTPVVTDTFLLEVVDTTLSLTLTTEQPYWKPCNPFESSTILSLLSQQLQEPLGISLAKEFQRELQANSRF